MTLLPYIYVHLFLPFICYTQVQATCPTPWHSLDTTCIYFVNDSKNWAEAGKYCFKNKSFLLTLCTSSMQSSFIGIAQKQLGEKNNPFITGIWLNTTNQRCENRACNFSYSNYMNWESYPPSDNYCSTIITRKSKHVWISETCGITRHTVCQKFDVSGELQALTSTTSVCKGIDILNKTPTIKSFVITSRETLNDTIKGTYIVKQGSQFAIHCNVSQIVFKIHFTYEPGIVRPNKIKNKTCRSSNQCTLIINKAGIQDHGKYNCTLSQEEDTWVHREAIQLNVLTYPHLAEKGVKTIWNGSFLFIEMEFYSYPKLTRLDFHLNDKYVTFDSLRDQSKLKNQSFSIQNINMFYSANFNINLTSQPKNGTLKLKLENDIGNLEYYITKGFDSNAHDGKEDDPVILITATVTSIFIFATTLTLLLVICCKIKGKEAKQTPPKKEDAVAPTEDSRYTNNEGLVYITVSHAKKSVNNETQQGTTNELVETHEKDHGRYTTEEGLVYVTVEHIKKNVALSNSNKTAESAALIKIKPSQDVEYVALSHVK